MRIGKRHSRHWYNKNAVVPASVVKAIADAPLTEDQELATKKFLDPNLPEKPSQEAIFELEHPVIANFYKRLAKANIQTSTKERE